MRAYIHPILPTALAHLFTYGQARLCPPPDNERQAREMQRINSPNETHATPRNRWLIRSKNGLVLQEVSFVRHHSDHLSATYISAAVSSWSSLVTLVTYQKQSEFSHNLHATELRYRVHEVKHYPVYQNAYVITK